MNSAAERLALGLQALGLELESSRQQKLLAHLDLISRWNRVYNLTAVRDPAEMLTHHLLDSLAIVGPLARHVAACAEAQGLGAARAEQVPDDAGETGAGVATAYPLGGSSELLDRSTRGMQAGVLGGVSPEGSTGVGVGASDAGASASASAHLQPPGRAPFQVLDVGSGAGLPGVTVAIALTGEPTVHVTCVDAVLKKVGFIRQVAGELGLRNLSALHGRIEDLRCPPANVITCRAFASLADIVRLTAAHLAPGGVWMVMKGQNPADEMKALPAEIEVFHVEPLKVPFLDAQRCLVWMRPRTQSPLRS